VEEVSVPTVVPVTGGSSTTGVGEATYV
jgi:hypothetical protein